MALLKRLAAAVASLLPVAGAAATQNIAVGGKVIAIPVPDGMQDVSNRGATVRSVIDADIPPDVLTLHACYLPIADVALFDKGRADRLDRQVKVVTYRPEDHSEKSLATFEGYQKVTEESLAKRQATRYPATIIERSEHYFSYVGLRDEEGNEATGEPKRTIVSAVLTVLIDGKQLSYFVSGTYRDDADVNWAKSVVLSLRKAMPQVSGR